MKISVVALVVAAALVARGTPAFNDQQSAAAPAASPTPTAATPAPDANAKKVIRVSDAYMKELRNAGYYPKNDKSELVFCKKDAMIGSPFTRERCFDREQLAMELEADQAQRQQLLGIAAIGHSGR